MTTRRQQLSPSRQKPNQMYVHNVRTEASEIAATYKQLDKLFTHQGEQRAGVRKPPAGRGECCNCGKKGHYKLECRAPPQQHQYQQQGCFTAVVMGITPKISTCHTYNNNEDTRRDTANRTPSVDLETDPDEQHWGRFGLLGLVCWSLTSLCHSNGHIETMPAREINPFTALTRIRSQFLRTQ